jgi:hypothetical protein
LSLAIEIGMANIPRNTESRTIFAIQLCYA